MHQIITLFAIVATLIWAPAQADSIQPYQYFPPEVPDYAANPYPPLEDTHAPWLQQRLDALVDQAPWNKAAQKKRLGIALIDITDPYRPMSAFINPKRMMYSASLPKIAILLAVTDKISTGQVRSSGELQDKMRAMIRKSSNTAASDLFHVATGSYIASLLQSDRYKLYNRQQGGGLWVGRAYNRGKLWRRDPLHNLSHGANALQAARFYYLLESEQLISPYYSRMMKRVFGRPEIHHKFVKGLKLTQADVGARKSGSWRHWHADSAIITHNKRRYIAVVLAEDATAPKWFSSLILSLDHLIMNMPTDW